MLAMDRHEREMRRLGLNDEQVGKLRLMMAQHALDALVDSQVAEEAAGILEVESLLTQCRKWKLTPEEINALEG
jgi:hypothetical protein